MGTRFFLEGLWQQFINTRVTFKLLAKDDFGNPKDTPASVKMIAVLRGPKEYHATVEKESTGVYALIFDKPDYEGDYQMSVMVNGHLLYQWLVQLRPQTAHSGAAVTFLVDGPGLGNGKVGVPTHLFIHARNGQKQPVDVPIYELQVLLGTSLNEKKARITKESIGEYKATWTLDRAGAYPVDVRYHGNSILVPVPTVFYT
eukprot:TRINITY_DN5280_c0_g1_i1.p1 TRINITY_DN5280_c0_g1~~TRINITY_DN5280_c0_g1_i1.p1  ORF type:complete len:201 (-),score=38.39 TRINITY_DN5280_c0_g1_i1:32-634(-)